MVAANNKIDETKNAGKLTTISMAMACPKRVGSFGYDTGFLFLMRKERQQEVI